MNKLLHNFPMPITTPRLIIQPPQLNDAQAVHTAILESFEELHKFMPWAQEKQTIEATEEFIRTAVANWILQRNEEPYLPLFIFDNITKEFIGATGLHHFDWQVPCLEVGYWIRTSRAGKGLMTEAINALTQYAFKELQVKRIAITCDTQNTKSKNIPERLGYTLEGELKFNRITNNNKISNTYVFARYNLDGMAKLETKW